MPSVPVLFFFAYHKRSQNAVKLDIFNHVLPPKFIERLADFVPKKAIERFKRITNLHGIDARTRTLDEFDDFQQILSMSSPTFGEIASPDDTPELARLANDGMAEMCKAHPDRYVGFISSLPMNNPDAAVKEIDRTVSEHNATGIQIYSNVSDKALSSPEFFPVFERMSQFDLPVWLHPARRLTHADYLSEDKSLYDIWWGLGWAYETSVAMTRIVFSGMFDKLPDLKIIAHHWGTYIPHAEGRFSPLWERRPTQWDDEQEGRLTDKLKKSMSDYFKMFYADTAMFGRGARASAASISSAPAIRCLPPIAPSTTKGGGL